jgi:hypothetical protein
LSEGFNFGEMVERCRARVEELRSQGLSEEEIVKRLVMEGYKAPAISKVLRISGRLIPKRPRGDPEFVENIERVRRDPKIPIIAREIDDYAWWRRVCYNLGIEAFYRLSPLAGLTYEDQKDAERALQKLTRVQTDLFQAREEADLVKRENEQLRLELEEAKRELEAYREFAKGYMERLKKLQEIAKQFERVAERWGA